MLSFLTRNWWISVGVAAFLAGQRLQVAEAKARRPRVRRRGPGSWLLAHGRR
jgi:hypothetical protein